jgi:deoxyribose-phosphate aldolase
MDMIDRALIGTATAEALEAARRAGFTVCTCHRRVRERCPGPGVVVGAPAAAGPPGDLASRIDHTLLRMDATAAEIDRHVSEAAAFRFAAVAVNPVWVAHAARRLDGTPVRVASVVGFPLGATLTAVKAIEARDVTAAGAAEIDVVLNVGWLRSARLAEVLVDLLEVVSACGPHIVVKAILETGALTDADKVRAAVLAQAAGARFVKTSTGFGPSGATVADVALLRATVESSVGVKASGGVRDYATTMRLISAGASRIGTSAGVAIVDEARRHDGW